MDTLRVPGCIKECLCLFTSQAASEGGGKAIPSLRMFWVGTWMMRRSQASSAPHFSGKKSQQGRCLG
jgi:hypothetical protein